MRNTLKTKTALPTSAALYVELDIEPSLQQQLETSASFIFDLGRRTTEQTFELGDHLASAAKLLADGTFDKWVKRRCGLNARSARNYMAVFRNLTPYRDDLVDLSAGSTVLFHLASATPEQVEEAIKFAEDNGRLQVADVKAILASGEEGKAKAAEADLHSIGGITGLKAMIAVKIRDGLKAFLAHIAMICQAIEAALSRTRVIKEALAKEIQELARIARQELESLALFVEPELDFSRNARATRFPKASHWAKVNETLYSLGGVDTWPKAGEMRKWLQAEVLPVLNWAVATERRPEWPLDQQAAAAAPAVAVNPVASAGSVADLSDLADPADVSVEPDVVTASTMEDMAAAEARDAVAVSGGSILPLEEALAAASGGAFTVTREVPKARDRIAAVPPLASEEAADENARKEETLAEDVIEEEAAAPAVLA